MRAWLSVFLAVIPLSQAAAKTVVTSGEATDCYLATLDEASTGKSEQGLAICSRAIEDAGDNPGLRAALLANSADIRVKMQDYAGAVADATASIAIAPRLPAAYLNLGAGLVGLRRYKEALTALEKAIELGLADRLHLAYYDGGIAKEQLGDIRGAYYAYKKALEISPDFTPAKDQLSRFRVTTSPK